jgi:hypothetical protein
VAHHYLLGSLFTFIALIGSMMVSYTRARAEGLGVESKGGLMQRPERVVLLGVSSLACGLSSAFLGGDYKLFIPGVPFHVFETMSILTLPITILAVLANITAVSRLLQARKALDAKDAAAAAASVAALPTPVAVPTRSTAAARMLAIGLFFCGLPLANAVPPSLVFPVPTGVANQLFYLQRDPNINTVIYQLNVNGAGKLDEDEPVHVFWIRYGEHGEHKDLNFIQRKFAYGLSAKKVATDRYVLKFAAYDKVPFYLQKTSADNAFHVVTVINNKQIVINRVYLRIEGGTFWVPNVKYIEVKGWNAATREPVVERLSV